MVPKQLEDMIAVIKKTNPDFYQKCYPKPYHSGGQWPSPKYFAYAAFESMLQKSLKFKKQGEKIDSVSISVYYTVARLLELNVPTYFVAPNLFQALSQSELPPTLHLNELKWPLDAMLFVLPRGALHSPSGETLYLAIALNQAGRRSVILADDANEYITTSFDAITTFAFTASEFMYGWSHPVNEDLVTNIENDPIQDLFSFDESSLFSIKIEKLPEADVKFAKLHYRLAIQLMLSMIARPELIQKEQIIKHPNIEKGKRGLFSPNILGINYKTQQEYHGGTHESPIAHWRRGFFRYYIPSEGKPWKREQIKWIEPVLVLGK